MVKHFVADGRFDFIESGSLISIRRNTQGILIPSEEEKLALTPLDFEEFLWGLNREDLFDYVRSCFEKEKPQGDALHREVMKLFASTCSSAVCRRLWSVTSNPKICWR